MKRYTLIQDEQVMRMRPVITQVQQESTKESSRNLDILRSYYFSACYHGGIAAERKFQEELLSHLSEYESTVVRGNVGLFRSQIRKMSFEKLCSLFTNPEDLNEEMFKTTITFYEKGNRPTNTRKKEKTSEKQKYEKIMQRSYELSEERISTLYRERTDFIPFLSRTEFQCSAIVNDDIGNIMCCGNYVSEKSRFKFCTSCSRLYCVPSMVKSVKRASQ